MKIHSIQSPSFGKLYYGADPKTLTKTQKDVLQDINDLLEDNNYVKRLEDLQYDIYIEPNKDGYAMGIAFFKNFSIMKNGKPRYDKVVNMGSYVIDTISKYTQKMQNSYSTETLKDRFYKFFKNEAYGKYKRYVNYL